MDVIFQKIICVVKINGGRITNVVGVDVSMGVSQINAQAVIHLTGRPGSAVEGASVEIWLGYGDESHTSIVFKGELDGTEWEYFPGVVSLPARDLLARVRYDWGGDDREYTEEDDAAVERNLLEAMGIPSSAAEIVSSGWTLGVIEIVVAPGGRPFWSLIEEIDNLAGFRTYTDRSGAIRRYRVSGNIGVGSAFQYAEGDNIVRITRKRSLDGIVNKCVITGLDYEGLAVGGAGVAEAFADNPFVPDPPKYITLAIQSNLIEDDEKALEIATRMVRDKNRRPETFEIEVIGEPRIQPLSIIAIQHSDVEVSGGKLIVDRVQHTIRGASFRTTITTLGGTVDATATNIPPVAAFDLKLFKEGEDTGSGVSAVITGVADGSASSDPDGDTAALTYLWTAEVDAGTVTPSSGSGAVYRFAIEGAATTVTVTLVVTDAGGADNTLARTLALNSSSFLFEPLYTAEDGLIAASADGEQTWSEFTVSGDACTPPFAPDWGTIWGASDGHIWASIDKLATPAVDLGAPHSSVACTAVWINEVDTTRLWAAFDDGKVYSGTMDPLSVAAVWVLAGTIPEGPVQEIRESVGALGDLRATAGQGYYHSGDGGASWELLHTFDTAWRMAAGFDHNLASGLNSTPPLFDEAGSAPTIDGSPTHIRGLSFGWREQELYATDDAAQLYLADSTFANLALQTDALPAQGNQMIRSGNVDRVVYIACGDGSGSNNGAVKWMPGVKAPWYIRKTTARRVNAIGYGPAAPITAPVALIIPPYGATGAADFFWRYTPGVGWEGIAPPQPSWYWFGIVVDPFNRSRYLAWGNNVGSTQAYDVGAGVVVSQDHSASPLYRSDDAGATWTAIQLGTNEKTESYDIMNAAWSEDTPNLWMVTNTLDQPLHREQVCFWRDGTGAASVSLTGIWNSDSTGTHNPPGALTSGVGGEFIGSVAYDGNSVKDLGYVGAGATSLTPSNGGPGGGSLAYQIEQLDKFPLFSRAVVGMGGALSATNLQYFSDYHFVTGVNPVVDDAGAYCTVAADGSVFVGGRTGILQVTGIDSSPVSVVVPGTEGIAVGYIRAGRAQRRAVAARRSGTIDCFVKGAVGAWALLAGPAAVTDPGMLANWVEVIDGPEAV